MSASCTAQYTHEQAWVCNERYVFTAEVVCKYSTEVMKASLAGTICESLHGGNPESVNASDINDSGRIARRGGFFEHRSD